MLKKQGIIEAKPPSKPSFKNILNIEQAKLPSPNKSRSKSKKSVTQQKISTVPNRSPRKAPPRFNNNDQNNTSVSNESVMSPGATGNKSKEMRYESERSVEKSGNGVKYEEINSQFNRSKTSKSPKKDPHKQAMKQVVLLKNKTVQIEQQLQSAYQSATFGQKQPPKSQLSKQNHKNNPNQSSYQSANPRLRGLQKKLDTHLSDLKQICTNMQQQYNNKFQQLARNIGEDDNTRILETAMGNASSNRKERVIVGMPQLERKLAELEMLFQ